MSIIVLRVMIQLMNAIWSLNRSVALFNFTGLELRKKIVSRKN